MKITCYAVFALLFLFLVGCSSGMQGVSHIHPSLRDATVTPSATVAPTVTITPIQPSPTPVPIPRIGNTLASWDAFYGAFDQNNAPGQPMHIYHSSEFGGLLLAATYENKYVSSLSIMPAQGITWNNGVPALLVAQEQPQDALYLQDNIIPNGVQEIYQSKTLASEFPASDFLDSNGKQVVLGTYSVLLLPGHIIFALGRLALS